MLHQPLLPQPSQYHHWIQQLILAYIELSLVIWYQDMGKNIGPVGRKYAVFWKLTYFNHWRGISQELADISDVLRYILKFEPLGSSAFVLLPAQIQYSIASTTDFGAKDLQRRGTRITPFGVVFGHVAQRCQHLAPSTSSTTIEDPISKSTNIGGDNSFFQQTSSCYWNCHMAKSAHYPSSGWLTHGSPLSTPAAPAAPAIVSWGSIFKKNMISAFVDVQEVLLTSGTDCGAFYILMTPVAPPASISW